MDYEKKNYKSLFFLVLSWCIGLILLILVLKNLMGSTSVSKFIYIYTLLLLYAISYIIKKYDRIYWISSFTYFEVTNMSMGKIRAISQAFYTTTKKYTGILSIIFLVSIIFNLPFVLDTIFFSIGLCIYAYKMMKTIDCILKDFD